MDETQYMIAAQVENLHGKLSFKLSCISKAYSSCFMHVIVARMRLPLFLYIFAQNFQMFCLFLLLLHTCCYFLE